MTISSNVTFFVVTTFFWPFTMMVYFRGCAGPLWKCSSSPEVHGLLVVFDDRGLPCRPHFAEEVIAGLDMAELVERLAGGRVRRLVGFLVNVNSNVLSCSWFSIVFSMA